MAGLLNIQFVHDLKSDDVGIYDSFVNSSLVCTTQETSGQSELLK